MSVLTELSISYESLVGEPSFFVTAQQATPLAFETQQTALSLPYISETAKSRPSISSFDISPSFSTRHTFGRPTTSNKPKVMPNRRVVEKTATIETIPTLLGVVTDISKPARSLPKASIESRGLFNEFERASLLSYMQRRQLT